MKKNAKGVGLAIIGAGRVGLFRGEVAARHPAVEWIGIAELNHNRGGDVAARIGADFVTTDYRALLGRPEVTAAIIATDEHLHVDPILAAVERGVPMLVEKPLATDLAQSACVLKAITDAKLDAVVGYTQRFRRKWLAGKEKVRSGALGDVTMVTSRAFMNRLVAIDNYKRTDDPAAISPMVISGTHALDIVMWYLEGKQPVECYARSVDKVLGPLYHGIDATAGMIMCADGTIYHLNISWALPVTWPGAVYSLEVGVNGTHGVLTIDDTHRDMVLAVSAPQSEGYAPDESRLVDFLGSYPPGDMALGELRGPMREETDSFLNRVSLGLPTQAASAAEAHDRLMLTKALDLSAKLKAPVKLPLDPEVEHARSAGRARLICCLSIIFSESRHPPSDRSPRASLFGIMLHVSRHSDEQDHDLGDLFERAHYIAGLTVDLTHAQPRHQRDDRDQQQCGNNGAPRVETEQQYDKGDRRRRRDAFARRPARIMGQAIAARRRQQPHQNRHRGARGTMRADQRPHHRMGIGQTCERGDPQQQRQHQGANAISACTAVAHDVEFLLPCVAAAETVCGIGEAVLVQRAGDDKCSRDSQCSGRPSRQAEPMRERINQRANQPDDEAGERQRPGRFRDRLFRRRAGKRQARAEGEARLELLRPILEPNAGNRCHAA
jgi:myo-inositol 2-dehydrogenase/D-chiro-inositol 1-dehydrogenase